MFYLVAVERNEPVKILEMMGERGFSGTVGAVFVSEFADGVDCVEEESWWGSIVCSTVSTTHTITTTE